MILNRDLRAGRLPRHRVVGLDAEGHDAAWREVERFARSFDPDAWAAGGGPSLDAPALLDGFRDGLARGDFPVGSLAELRAALAAWVARGAPKDGPHARVVDGLLDATHLRLADKQRRVTVAPPPLEPALGTAGAGDGLPCTLVAREAGAGREALYARAAGVVLCEGATALTLAAARYPRDGAPRREDAFTLWPPEARLGRLLVASSADLAHDHDPPLPPDPDAADLLELCPPRPLAAAGYALEAGHAEPGLQLVLDGPAVVVSSPSGMHLRGIVLHLAAGPDGVHLVTVTRSFSGTGVPFGVLAVGPALPTLGAAADARATALQTFVSSHESYSPGLQPARTAAESDLSPARAAAAIHERPVPPLSWWHRVEHVVRGAYGPAGHGLTWLDPGAAAAIPLRR